MYQVGCFLETTGMCIHFLLVFRGRRGLRKISALPRMLYPVWLHRLPSAFLPSPSWLRGGIWMCPGCPGRHSLSGDVVLLDTASLHWRLGDGSPVLIIFQSLRLQGWRVWAVFHSYCKWISIAHGLWESFFPIMVFLLYSSLENLVLPLKFFSKSGMVAVLHCSYFRNQ